MSQKSSSFTTKIHPFPRPNAHKIPSPMRKTITRPIIKNTIMKPPPIILPIGKAAGPTANTPAPINKNIFNNSNNDFNIKLGKLHPLTPHAHAVSEIKPLIQRCVFADVDHSLVVNAKSEILEQKEITVSRIFSEGYPHSIRDQDVSRINDTLKVILKLVSDPVYRHGISQENYESLVNLCKDNIFRNHIRTEEPNEFSEVTVNYEVKNWENIELHHKILRNLMLDHNNFYTYLDRDLSMKLVESLDTPVVCEQQAFEETIKLILDTYIGQRQDILRYMTEKIISYLERPVKSNIMNSLLRLFFAYFTSLKPPLKQSYFMTFRTVFYPLFATPYSYDFETSLRDISIFFQMQDPATAFWCLKYLTKHWPKTNPKKCLLFLHELTEIVNYLPEALVPSACPLIAKNFAFSISSPHVATCVYSILFCQNDSFLHIFNSAPDQVYKYIIPAIDIACNMWKNDTRDIALSLKEKLLAVIKKKVDMSSSGSSNSLSHAANNDGKSPNEGTWNSLAKFAANNDSSFSSWNYEEKYIAFTS